MKLQARLAIVVGSTAALAILLMAVGFITVGARQQLQVIDEQLLEVVSEPRQLIPGVINEGGRNGGRRGGLDDVFLNDGPRNDRLFTRVRLVGPRGNVLIDDELPEVDTTTVRGAELSTVEIDGDRFRMAVARVGNDGSSVLQVATNIEGLRNSLVTFRMQVLGASALGIALAAILGWLVAQRLTAPITTVAAAAREIAESPELPSPLDVNRSDEVGDLAMSFNELLSALHLSREQQHRLVADASHELRTPLTSLRLKLDLLDSTPELDAAKRQELLSASAGEVEQLGDLVTELVHLATDPTGVDEQPQRASLGDLAREIASVQSQRTGREVVVHGGEFGEPLLMRPKMVGRAISNLIDNAVKYSPVGAAVLVVVDGPRIHAEDHGTGIPPEDLPYVFDRFFRSATARTRPGNGIGLAIVRRVAVTHDGEVWARNKEDGTGAIVGFSVATS